MSLTGRYFLPPTARIDSFLQKSCFFLSRYPHAHRPFLKLPAAQLSPPPAQSMISRKFWPGLPGCFPGAGRPGRRLYLQPRGIADVFLSGYGNCHISCSAVSCDYFDFMQSPDDSFQGDYMFLYSWAEERVPELLAIRDKKK